MCAQIPDLETVLKLVCAQIPDLETVLKYRGRASEADDVVGNPR